MSAEAMGIVARTAWTCYPVLPCLLFLRRCVKHAYVIPRQLLLPMYPSMLTREKSAVNTVCNAFEGIHFSHACVCVTYVENALRLQM